MEEPQSSLLDITLLMDSISIRLDHTAKVDDIKDLATKNDLKEMDDRILAQGQEIQQLRGKINSLRNNVASIQLTVDGQIGRDPGYGFSNTADRTVNKPQIQTTQQRNLVIEGLNGNSETKLRQKY